MIFLRFLLLFILVGSVIPSKADTFLKEEVLFPIVTNMIVAGSSAAMAEVLVEQWTNVRGTYERLHQENPNMDQPEFIRKVQAETAGARTAAHLVTATLAGIGSELANPGSGASAVHVASHSAQIAMDHNFMNLVIGAGLTLNTLQPYYEAYQAAGGGAAGRAAVARLVEANGGAASLGIEIAVNFAGGALVMKAGSKLVNFIRGAGMTFVKGEQKINEVAQAERFSKTCRADDKRAAEKLKPHGNSKNYKGETHVYAIREASTGKVHKVGESMRGTDRYGQSLRAKAQARRLQHDTGKRYETEIRETFLSKAEARNWETRLIQRLRNEHGPDKLPGNKGIH